MKLTLTERISLMNVLPPEGSIVTLRIIRELQNHLSFTEDELKKYRMKNRQMPDGSTQITWDNDFSNAEKEIEIGEAAKGVIADNLRRLDSQGKLHISMLSVYEKFVEGKV